MAYEERLGRMDEAWKVNREEKGGFNEQFEPSTQTFQLQGLGLQESGGGHLMCKMEHFCTDGPNRGDIYTSFFNLERPSDKDGKIWGQIFMAQALEKMGYETPEDFGQLEETLAAIQSESPVYIARITQSGQYKNFTIQRVIDAESGETPAAAESKSVLADAPIHTTPPKKNGKTGRKKATKKVTGPSDDDVIAFCEAYEIPVKDGETRADHFEKIKEFMYDKSALTEAEIAVVEAAGATYQPAAAK